MRRNPFSISLPLWILVATSILAVAAPRPGQAQAAGLSCGPEISPAASAAGNSSEPECWEGNMHSTTQQSSPAGMCVGEGWETELRLLVDSNGNVSGDAAGHLASMPACSGGGYVRIAPEVPQTQARNFAAEVSGHRSEQQFELLFTETKMEGATWGYLNYSLGMIPPTSPRVTIVASFGDDTAEGETKTSVNVPASVGAVAIGQHKVVLDCKRGCILPRAAD